MVGDDLNIFLLTTDDVVNPQQNRPNPAPVQAAPPHKPTVFSSQSFWDEKLRAGSPTINQAQYARLIEDAKTISIEIRMISETFFNGMSADDFLKFLKQNVTKLHNKDISIKNSEMMRELLREFFTNR